MLVYDDCTTFSIVKLLRTKCEAPKAIQDSVKELERIPACRKRNFCVGRIRSDNAKEFATRKLNDWLDEKGIRQEFSAPYYPEPNGKAERLDRTVMDMARTLLASTGNVPNKDALWARQCVSQTTCVIAYTRQLSVFQIILLMRPWLEESPNSGTFANLVQLHTVTSRSQGAPKNLRPKLKRASTLACPQEMDTGHSFPVRGKSLSQEIHLSRGCNLHTRNQGQHVHESI